MRQSEFVHIKEGKALLSLNMQLYSEAAIQTTAEDFSENFSATISKDNNTFHISLTPKNHINDGLLHIAGMEFCNYALSLMQSG